MIVIDKPMVRWLLAGRPTEGRTKGERTVVVGQLCYAYVERHEPMVDRYGEPRLKRGEPILKPVHVRLPHHLRVIHVEGERVLLGTAETVRYLSARAPYGYVSSPAQAARTSDNLPEEAADVAWLARVVAAAYERDHAIRVDRIAVRKREKSLARLERKRENREHAA